MTSVVKGDNILNLEEWKKSKRTSIPKWNPIWVLIRIFILITCIKVLLIPTYYSTDFEVHRNWLAITYSLPIKEWYVNTKSQWTLDYPPLFAWFEYFLGQLAVFFDPGMLKVENLNYASSLTVYFQRATVIFADLMFAYGVKELGKVLYRSYDSYCIFIFLSLCNVGLLIVDHIHFQYNGFLLGILLLSMAKVSETRKQVSILQGAAWFALLLNLKHIYLYVAPVYVVWLLKSYCIHSGHFFKRIFILASIVFTILSLSFGPFINQLPQVIARLFPFKRGLVHAYWAANAWALYIGIDKILSLLWKKLGWLKMIKSAAMTGGLVQEESFIVLPTPKPIVTFILTFMLMFPALYCLFCRKDSVVQPLHFIRCLVLCGLTSFMFGWHVHEKAILTTIIPLCAAAVININDAKIFIILSSTGCTALLPLLYLQNLTPLKLLLLLIYMFLTTVTLSCQFKKKLLYLYEWMYIGTLPLLTVYDTVLHTLIFHDKLPFLPLAFTSIYCAIGITYSWVLYYYNFICDCSNNMEEKIRRETVKESKKIS